MSSSSSYGMPLPHRRASNEIVMDKSIYSIEPHRRASDKDAIRAVRQLLRDQVADAVESSRDGTKRVLAVSAFQVKPSRGKPHRLDAVVPPELGPTLEATGPGTLATGVGAGAAKLDDAEEPKSETPASPPPPQPANNSAAAQRFVLIGTDRARSEKRVEPCLQSQSRSPEAAKCLGLCQRITPILDGRHAPPGAARTSNQQHADACFVQSLPCCSNRGSCSEQKAARQSRKLSQLATAV